MFIDRPEGTDPAVQRAAAEAALADRLAPIPVILPAVQERLAKAMRNKQRDLRIPAAELMGLLDISMALLAALKAFGTVQPSPAADVASERQAGPDLRIIRGR